MGLVSLFNNLLFMDFGAFVDFFSSYIPVLILFVFGVNVLFTILYDIIHFGGRF